MLLEDFLTLFTQLVFIIIAILTLMDYVRHRDHIRLDIFLMFGGLALVFLPAFISRIDPALSIPVFASLLGLFAQPYLFLRLARHFHNIQRWSLWAALALMVLVVSLTAPSILSDTGVSLSVPVIILVIVYFFFVNGYAVLIFSQEIGRTRGITRNRLILVASGSGLLGLAITLAAISSVFPVLSSFIGHLNTFLAALAGISYYLGFATPRSLTHIWQLNELNIFLREAAMLPQSNKGRSVLDQLCQSSIHAVGGKAAVVFLENEHDELAAVVSKGFDSFDQPVVIQTKSQVRDYLQSNVYDIHRSNQLAVAEIELGVSIDAETLFNIPIKSHEKFWGVLVVFLFRSPLFSEDDLSLLGLLAEQSAFTLENHQLLNEVQGYAAELEQRVAERTTELEAVNEELKQFASIVSHDLRAPLLNIRGFSQELRYSLKDAGIMLEDDKLNLGPDQLQALSDALEKDIPESLAFIDSSIVRMDGLLAALLKLSRLGRRELQFEHVDVQRVVNETLKTLGHIIETNKVEITVGTLPEVHADLVSLEQIFGNILTNAVNYLEPSRPGQIVVSARSGSDEIVFSVQDNGRGILKRDYPKIFTPLRRAGEQDVPGEGMGLAYVQTLVRMHDGKIWFESKPTIGTTFFFSISNSLNGGTHDA